MSEEYVRFSNTFFAKLDRLAAHQSVAVLIRHADRDALLNHDVGYELPITKSGVKRAYDFGEMLGTRISSLHSSPLIRCIQTAEAIKAGALVNMPIVLDTKLGDPGVYVRDGQIAMPIWQKMGGEEVVEHLVTSDVSLPGMAEVNAAAICLIRHMESISTKTSGVHLFVTHDAIITTTAAIIMGTSSRHLWPSFLEGAAFWIGDSIEFDYRDAQLQLDSNYYEA